MAKKRSGKKPQNRQADDIIKKAGAENAPADPAPKEKAPDPAPEKVMQPTASAEGEKKPDNEEDWTTTENVYERIARRDAQNAEPKLRTVSVARDTREPREEPVHEETPPEHQAEKKYSGPPLTEEEKRRIAAMENMLDRDLDSVRRKRDEEEAAERQREAARLKKEQERLDKLAERQRNLAEREAHAKENARLLEEAKAQAQAQPKNQEYEHETLTGVVSHGTSKVKEDAVEKSYRSGLFQMAAFRAVLVAVIAVIVIYGSAFLYARHINDVFYSDLTMQLTRESKLVTAQSYPYSIPSYVGMSEEQKESASLTKWLSDTDRDGLSDELEIEMSSNPLKADTNGNKIPDGAEYMTGNNPAAPANDTITDTMAKEVTLISDRLTANITGLPISADASLETVGNNSINGTPGLVEHAYEIFCTQSPESIQLTFAYPVSIVENSGYNENALCVFRFDSDDLSFHQVPSQRDDVSKTVTAQVSDNGIYALCDASVVMQKGRTQIFFLIDNSGSMYPEELCSGSEENDVEFKRLDFATSLIDMIGEQAHYGAGEFSGGYKNIVPISDDREIVKSKITALRDVVPPFSGT
ncbi:MAG: hypothetical protein IJ080_01940, partial [Oscillospiraceae bacterium]|nr:hypothetical protein [Oscillospiraceae bacterium]